MSVWKSDETLLSICILNFSFKNDFVWEEISNIRHSVSSPDETPRSSSKILRCASYFQLSSRCFIWWWNTASHVWYITSYINAKCRTIVTLRLNRLNPISDAFYWEIRISDFANEHEIRKRISPPRNPSSGWMSIQKSKSGFHGFPFYCSMGNPKKDLQNCSREQRCFFC